MSGVLRADWGPAEVYPLSPGLRARDRIPARRPISYEEPVLPCIVGGLLPDLIDTPLSLLILSGSVGSGRIFSHSLLFLLVLVIVGWVLLSRYRTPALLAVAIGVASYQVLDLM
ncbi:metal-dependent hydrolase [Methanosphaerula palustris]|uniref:metal-dependent hydrolase n=1 Tax=Methanosphaerula palustris TaxID=475088 RepID=UPI000184931C|nr:metal-dependent hydrolase [Methanosphaerula palustris]